MLTNEYHIKEKGQQTKCEFGWIAKNAIPIVCKMIKINTIGFKKYEKWTSITIFVSQQKHLSYAKCTAN
jgi:hypothetical protein